jgi:MFS family permease
MQGTTSKNDDPFEDEQRPVLKLLTDKRIQAFVVARGLPIITYIGFLTYISVVVMQLLNGTPVQAGLLTAVLSISYAGASTQTGRITARFDSWFWSLVLTNIVMSAGFTLFVFAPSLVVAGVGTALMGSGFGITISLYRSIIAELAPVSARGGVVGLSEVFGRLVITLTPIAIGMIITVLSATIGFEVSLKITITGAAVIAGGGGIVCLVVARRADPIRPL